MLIVHNRIEETLYSSSGFCFFKQCESWLKKIQANEEQIHTTVTTFKCCVEGKNTPDTDY